MSYSIVMPQLGLTMTEGAVSEWLKKTGDPVQKNEAVFIVSTDKVEMEVESAVEGTMGEILVSPGETVPVGATLAYLEAVDYQDAPAQTELGEPAATPSQGLEAAPALDSYLPIASTATESAKPANKESNRPQVSPRARRLAAELGISIADLRGTGQGGRVAEEDVRRAASNGSLQSRAKHRQRLANAERLMRSIQTIPALSLSAEANAEKLLSLRHSLQPLGNGNVVKITVTDLLLAIFASELKVSEDLNATWEKDGPRPKRSVDICLEISSDQGVVAPVIRNAAELSLTQLIGKRQELVEKGREGRLTPADLDGGVATLKNLGNYRVDLVQAIISPGQSCVLGVGSIRIRPWVESALLAKPTVILSLTVDHRLADGDTAATFLHKLIAIIENPARLWDGGSQPVQSAGQTRNG